MARQGCTVSDISILEKIIILGNPSLEDISRSAGISKTAILKHIRSLEKAGYVQRKYSPSGRGRPVCKISVRELQIRNKTYPNLRDEALNFIENEIDREKLPYFIDNYTESVTSYLKENLENLIMEDRIAEFSRIRNSEGYSTRIVYDDENEFTLIQGTCPISSFARKHRKICEQENLIFSEIFGMDSCLKETIATGSNVCSFSITRKKANQIENNPV